MYQWAKDNLMYHMDTPQLFQSGVQDPGNKEKKGAFYSQSGLSNHHKDWESCSKVTRLWERKVNSYWKQATGHGLILTGKGGEPRRDHISP